MQQFIGCVCILSATTGAGILYEKELKMYLDRLMYLRHIIYMLQGEIEYSAAPLPQVFRQVAGRVREPYRSWLRGLETQIEEREYEDFSRIWKRCFDRYLKELKLKKAHSDQLKELGDYLGTVDVSGESKCFALYLNRLEPEIQRFREEIAAKKRIGNCLGVMSGVFLVVVLL